MATEYTEVHPDVLEMAIEIIAEFHEELVDCRIGLVFRCGTPPKAGGKEVWGKCMKVPDVLIPYIPESLDMLIVLTEEVWSGLNDEQKRALVDHELCHIIAKRDKDGNLTGWSTVGHDFEEFNQILRRYGLWRTDLLSANEAFVEAAKQPHLFEMPEEPRLPLGKVVSLSGFNATVEEHDITIPRWATDEED